MVDSAALDQDPKLLIKAAKAGQVALRLFGGDPFLFCAAATDAAACAKAKVAFEVVPGVSAATAVPAYAGIPLTQDVTGDVRIIHAAEVSRMIGGARHAGDPRRGDRNRRHRQDADRGRLAGRHAVRDHMERHHDRSAHRGQHARNRNRGSQGRRGEPAHRARPRHRRGRRRGQGAAGSCPGSRPGRCSAGGCWCRGRRSRRPASATSCAPTARCPSRCRPSRSSRRGLRSRWSAPSAAW